MSNDPPVTQPGEQGIEDACLVGNCEYDPSIRASVYAVPASEGGTVTFTLDAGTDHAGRNYIPGGSR